MNINNQVLAVVKQAQAKLLVVTKYYDKTKTEQLIKALKQEPIVIGWGENRTNSLETKLLPRDQTHFIGRLQSRQLPIIAQHCQTIHSLASLKHAEKLNHIVEQNNYSKLKVFLQVNVAGDPDKEGIAPTEVFDFLVALEAYPQLEVVGLSSMGWGEFETEEKRQEFKDLLQLRDRYLPQGKTSAGTSRDYEIALAEGIDIVRVGQAILR